MRIVACLNGDRRPGAHPALPVSVDQLVADAHAVVAAGADAVHVHPRDPGGAESLEPQVVASLMEALRSEGPDVPVSLTTSLSAESDPWRRYDLVQRWASPLLPDSVTLNLHEAGSVDLAHLLEDRRVDVEAGVWTVEAARILVATKMRVSAVLVEPTQVAVEDAERNANAILSLLDRARVGAPRMLHGTDATAWPMLEAAVASGHDLRIGLEDTMRLPDGTEAYDNAALVAHAASLAAAAA
ncbi:MULTISPECIES: 3-keto-5-aminohexanoate cleavage protein [Nocardiopsidaceae]|uniref:3-keto-5-aminohexanoate cleavage protein n=2 Tax=Nocardiopsidaceae TaxID=83676 RepID=A0ABY6YP53_9ACTN|nr:3-keto-5-aminohexanoate cleavage protein [Streptomonospora nanhaiensis]WAE74177.1 3-keto-5-aminohexanoate cleavage protein [Streptomonospora nanhaiensis]